MTSANNALLAGFRTGLDLAEIEGAAYISIIRRSH